VLGALICERAGVLNLGIEGIFTAGAMAGWMAVWLGVDAVDRRAGGGARPARCSACSTPASPCRSACRSTSPASASRCSPRVVLLHLSHRAARTSPRRRASCRSGRSTSRISPTSRSSAGAVQQTALTWLAFAMVALVAWVLYRTPLGLALRAVGDNPDSVDAQGCRSTGCAPARWSRARR
jgi:general nucleoside transport system permease protein